MKHLDLFSGIGGFALAARWAGINTTQFVEIDSFCQKVLKKHWPDVAIHDDVKTFKSQFTDIITAGFPCQPFSCAGKRKGISDDRYLWPEVFRIIKESRADWIILENVPGIIPHLDPILEDLEREGYAWRAYLIPACAVGAPHKRERLWVVANSNGERCNNRFYIGKERRIQVYFQQYIEEIQSEWPQFFPQSWKTFSTQEWLTSDTDSERCETQSSDNQEQVPGREKTQFIETSIQDRLSCDTNELASKQTDKTSVTEQNRWNTRERHSRLDRQDTTIFNWEEDQPPISGVDDGLPFGLDRNKSLGNAIVPQIAYIFMKIIKVIHDENI